MILLSKTTGDRHRSRKLSSKDVKAIREARRKGVCAKKLAAQYNVHQNTIYSVARRNAWKSVE